MDLPSFGKKEQIVELLLKIEQALVENNCLTYPTCYLMSDLIEPSLNEKLKEIIKKHKGRLFITSTDLL